jgi:predicted phage terminase large subunit-like protein
MTPEPAPLAWARRYLPHYFTETPAEFHAELMADLADPARRLIARVAPRGHAKSTCAALAYPLWCVCEQRRRNIVLITQEATLATQFLRDLRHELESNDLIRAAYGDLCTPTDPEAHASTGQTEPEAQVRTAARKPRKPAARSAPRHPRPARSHTDAAPRRPAAKRATAPRPRNSARSTDKPAARSRESTNRNPRSATAPPSHSARRTPHSAPRRSRPKWTQALLTTTTGITIQARSVGAGFRGTRVGPNRPDLIICDDIEKDELVATPAGRRKLEHWLRRVVMPALAPGGQLLVLGSLIHYDSLLANLRDPQRFPGWDYRLYRARETRPGPDGALVTTALWPARWPLERLAAERQRIGTLAFEQEYMGNPIDDDARVFRPEWLRRWDPRSVDVSRLDVVMAVDPAAGLDDGDYFALWVGGVARESGVIHTLRLSLERIGIVAQVQRIMAAFEQYKPLKIGIETTAYQVVLKQILDDLGRRQRRYLPVVPIAAHANKRARIEGSAPFYENGTFLLPPELDPEVESQFLHFPRARHDDAPDVCAMGIELARTLPRPGPLTIRLPRRGITRADWW